MQNNEVQINDYCFMREQRKCQVQDRPPFERVAPRLVQPPLTLYQTYRADHPPAAEIRAGSGAQLRDGRWLQCRRSQVGWEVAVGEVSRLQQRRTSL